jgi:hypothetical protein
MLGPHVVVEADGIWLSLRFQARRARLPGARESVLLQPAPGPVADVRRENPHVVELADVVGLDEAVPAKDGVSIFDHPDIGAGA